LAQEITTGDLDIGLMVSNNQCSYGLPKLTRIGPYMSKMIKPRDEDDSDDDL
jgi:hypothetical protein